jgi:hypothetical protein
LRVAAGTHTNGIPCAAAIAATTASEPVAAGHSERVGAGRRGFTGQRGQVLAPIQDDGLDPRVARSLV